MSSVGVTQMAHRRMLFLANRLPHSVRDPLFTWLQEFLAPHTEVCPVFDLQAEVRNDRPFPLMGGEQLSVWSIYIDNLTEDEILPLFTALELVVLTSPGRARADARYVQWASPGSDEKIVNREANRTVLGCRYSGFLGRIDTPEDYPARLAGATMWLLSQPLAKKRWVKVVAGRWFRQMLMRRATMLSFARLWKWIARAPMTARLPDSIMAELFSPC